MDLNEAIKKVGKVMGETKFHRYMNGGMIPNGDIGTAETISTIFGVTYEEVNVRLNKAMNTEYKKILENHLSKVTRRQK